MMMSLRQLSGFIALGGSTIVVGGGVDIAVDIEKTFGLIVPTTFGGCPDAALRADCAWEETARSSELNVGALSGPLDNIDSSAP